MTSTSKNHSTRMQWFKADETILADLRPVLCIPARDEADDVVAIILSQILVREGHSAKSIPIASAATMLSAVYELNPRIVYISALPPQALGHARALYAKLREQFPELHIVICLWHFKGNLRQAGLRLRMAKDHGLLTSLPDVSQHIAFRLRAAAAPSVESGSLPL